MPNDLLVYEIFDLPGLVDQGVLRPLGAHRYQFTRDYLHNPAFYHPTKAHIAPLRASGIWRANAGNIIKITDLSSPTPIVQRPGQQAFQFQFEFGGTAYQGYFGPVRFLPPIDTGPTADAGPDQTVKGGDVVFLQGSGSDPDGDMLTYSWQQVSGPVVTLQQASQQVTAFLAPLVSIVTIMTFQLNVTANNRTATDSVNVTITP